MDGTLTTQSIGDIFRELPTPRSLIGIEWLSSGIDCIKDVEAMVVAIGRDEIDAKRIAGNRDLKSPFQTKEGNKQLPDTVSLMHLPAKKVLTGQELFFQVSANQSSSEYKDRLIAKQIAILNLEILRRPERIIWDLCEDGSAIAITEDQAPLSYSANIPAANKVILTGGDKWNTATAQIRNDIKRAINELKKYGITDVTAFYPLNVGITLANHFAELQNGLSEKIKEGLDTGIDIIPNGFCGIKWRCVYDNYVTDSDVATDFLTDGYVIFAPTDSGQAWRFLRARNMLDGQFGFGSYLKESFDPRSIEILAESNLAPHLIIGEAIYTIKVY